MKPDFTMKRKEFDEILAKSPMKDVKEDEPMWLFAYGFFIAGCVEGMKEAKSSLEEVNEALKGLVGK